MSEGNLIASDIHECWKRKNNRRTVTKTVYKYVPAGRQFVLHLTSLKREAKFFYHDVSGKSVELACAKISDPVASPRDTRVIENFRNKDFILNLPDIDVGRKLDEMRLESISRSLKTMEDKVAKDLADAQFLARGLSPVPRVAEQYQLKVEWYQGYLEALSRTSNNIQQLWRIYDMLAKMPVGYFISGQNTSGALTSTDILPDNGIDVAARKLIGKTLYIRIGGHLPVLLEESKTIVKLQIFREDGGTKDLIGETSLGRFKPSQEMPFNLEEILRENGCYVIIIEAVCGIFTGKAVALIQYGPKKRLWDALAVWGLKENQREARMLWPPVAHEVFAPVKERLDAYLGKGNVIAVPGSAHSYLGYRKGDLYAVAVPTTVAEEVSKARYIIFGTSYFHRTKARNTRTGELVTAYDIPNFGREKIALPPQGFAEIRKNCVKMLVAAKRRGNTNTAEGGQRRARRLFAEIVHFTASNPYMRVKDLRWDRIGELGNRKWKFTAELGHSDQEVEVALVSIGLLRAYDLYPYVPPQERKELPIPPLSVKALAYRMEHTES
jgi:hypothetical protein